MHADIVSKALINHLTAVIHTINLLYNNNNNTNGKKDYATWKFICKRYSILVCSLVHAPIYVYISIYIYI